MRLKTIKRYEIREQLQGTSTRRLSTKLKTYSQARKLVARLKRRGVEAYFAGVEIRVPVASN